MTALGAVLVLFVGLIALRQHRRAIRLEAAHDQASEAADDWSRIAAAEFEESDRLRAALRLENARYDAAVQVLFAHSPVDAIGAIDDLDAGRVPAHVEAACQRGGWV